jgi:hypothetical protein
VAHEEEMTEEQLQLLELIVDAYWSNEAGRPKDEFHFSTGFGDARTTLNHESFGDDEPRSDIGDIRELERLGAVTADWESPNQGRLRPTAPGKRFVEHQRHLEEIQRADREISGDGPGIDFATHLPVLEAVVHLYGEAAAGQDVSQMDVARHLDRPEGDQGVSRAFEVFERTGYLEGRTSVDHPPGPLTVAPSEKALQLLAGWPGSGEAAFQRLLATLDEQIEEAPDEERKGRLRAIRDGLVEIGEDFGAKLMAEMLKS